MNQRILSFSCLIYFSVFFYASCAEKSNSIFKIENGNIELKNNDTIHLNYPDGYLVLYCIGYDSTGNKIGRVNASWYTTGTLDSISNSKNISQLFYETSKIINNEEGYIIVKIDSVAIFQVYVIITNKISRIINKSIETNFKNSIDKSNRFYSFSINGRLIQNTNKTGNQILIINNNKSNIKKNPL